MDPNVKAQDVTVRVSIQEEYGLKHKRHQGPALNMYSSPKTSCSLQPELVFFWVGFVFCCCGGFFCLFVCLGLWVFGVFFDPSAHL